MQRAAINLRAFKPAPLTHALVLSLFCAASAQAAPADSALLDKLRLPADPRQAGMLRDAVHVILRSGLGRELAADYAAQGVPVPVDFDAAGECPISEVSGKKMMNCSAAALYHGRGGDRISFNRAFLLMGDPYIRANLPRILAHELLGHELTRLKAKKAGVASAYGYWIGDELNAIMVEWIIAAQTGHPMDISGPWSVTGDLNKYVKKLHTEMPTYAEDLDLDEMLHPGGVFAGRLAQVAAERKALDKSCASAAARQWFIGHLLEHHRGQVIAGQLVEPERFRQLADYYTWWVDTNTPVRRRRLSEIEKAVKAEAGRFSGRAGEERARGFAFALGSLNGSRFFRDRTRELVERRKMLAALLKGRARPTVKFPGPVPQKALSAMFTEELKNRCYEVYTRQIPPGDVSPPEYAQ